MPKKAQGLSLGGGDSSGGGSRFDYHTFQVRVFVPGNFSDKDKEAINAALERTIGKGHIVAEGMIVRIGVEGVDWGQGKVKGAVRVLQAAKDAKPDLQPSDVMVLEVEDEEGNRFS
jgi:hypothetical protein